MTHLRTMLSLAVVSCLPLAVPGCAPEFFDSLFGYDAPAPVVVYQPMYPPPQQAPAPQVQPADPNQPAAQPQPPVVYYPPAPVYMPAPPPMVYMPPPVVYPRVYWDFGFVWRGGPSWHRPHYPPPRHYSPYRGHR